MESFLRLKRNWTARSLTIVVMLSMVFWAHPQAWGLTIMESGDDFGEFFGNLQPVQSALGANTYSGMLTAPDDTSDYIEIELNGLPIVSGFVRYEIGGDFSDIEFLFFGYVTIAEPPTPIGSITVLLAQAGSGFPIPQFVLDTWNTEDAATVAILAIPASAGSFTIGITTTPEPSTLLTMASGLLLAGGFRWYRRRRSSALA